MFLLVLSLIVILSFSSLIFILDSSSPLGNIVAQGGHISNVSFNQYTSTSLWSVLYGEFNEFSGVSSYDLFAASINKTNFTSYGYDPSMVVLATTSSINYSDILQAAPALIDGYLGVGPAHLESGTNTFTELYNVSIGDVTVELYGVQTLSLNGSYITAAFLSNGNLHFITTTANGTSFDNQSAFFQFMLPVVGSQVYSFDVVSNITCPANFSIRGVLADDNLSVELSWSDVPGAIKYIVHYIDAFNASNHLEFSLVNQTNVTLNSFIHSSSANSMFYEVEAVLPVYTCRSNNTVGMIRLNLAPTANLISFPFSFVNNSVGEVLSPIMDSFISLNRYDNIAQTYDFYIKFMGSIFSNFDNVTLGEGYWLTINESVNLTLVGSLDATLSQDVYVQSNLVSFPIIEGNNTVPYVLRSIDDSYSTVNEYDNELKSYNFYIIFGGSVFSNFDTIKPGLAYWIYANETKTITLP